MKIENKVLEFNLREKANATGLYKPNDTQTKLVEKVIREDYEEITATIQRYRAFADIQIRLAILSGIRENRLIDVLQTMRQYPEGHCSEIRDRILKTIIATAEDEVEKGTPQQQRSPLTNLASEKGLVKPVFGIQHEQFFQNGIQAGNYWIDGAADTADTSQPKVRICRLEDSGFRDIESLEDYFAIGEKYWNTKFYPNTIIPELAPLFPAIQVNNQILKGRKRQSVLLHPIPLEVIASSIMRNGLQEQREFLESHKKDPSNRVDDETKRLILEALGRAKQKERDPYLQTVTPDPRAQHKVSIDAAFTGAEAALSARKTDPRLLDTLGSVVQAINRELLKMI